MRIVAAGSLAEAVGRIAIEGVDVALWRPCAPAEGGPLLALMPAAALFALLPRLNPTPPTDAERHWWAAARDVARHHVGDVADSPPSEG